LLPGAPAPPHPPAAAPEPAMPRGHGQSLEVAAPGDFSLSEAVHAGVASHAARQVDALEAKIMAMVSGHLREAEKMTQFLGRNVEARLEAVEQRQVKLEQRISDLGSGSRASSGCTRPTDEEALAREQRSRQRAERNQQQDNMDQDEELRQLKLAAEEAEKLERRLQQAECGAPEQLPHKAERDKEKERSNRKASESRSHASDCSSSRHRSSGNGERADVALMAVQELEALLQAEMKAIHKRCSVLQDTMDERLLLPMREVEQRLGEQDQRVRRLTDAGQDCSSRVEEHEFRLGVARTKLEVHDQKISRLEAMRWQRESTATGGITARERPEKPLSSVPAASSVTASANPQPSWCQ